MHKARLRPISRCLYLLNMVAFGCDMAPGASVGPGFAMPHPAGTGFGHDAVFGSNVRVFSGVRVGGGGLERVDLDGMPTIGNGCWLFDGAKVMGPIVVGADTVIGVNAWVTRDVPERSIVVGAPGRVVGQRDAVVDLTPDERRAVIAGRS